MALRKKGSKVRLEAAERKASRRKDVKREREHYVVERREKDLF